MKKLLIVLMAGVALGQSGNKAQFEKTGNYLKVKTSFGSWWANKDTSFSGTPGAVDWSTITNKPASFTPSSHSQLISSIYYLQDSLAEKSPVAHTHAGVYLPLHGLADSVPWSGVKNPPSTYAPSAHNQDWSTIQNQPSIPAAYDSATKYDTTYAPAKTMALNAATKKWNDSASTKLGAAAKAASATIADSTNGGAAKLNGKAATLYMDSTQTFRTARIIKLLVDTTKTIAAKRTAISVSGLATTDRAMVCYIDSISGSRKRGLSGVCKANTLVVFSDTTAGIVHAQVTR